MKKILSIFLSLVMLASCMVSFAEDAPAKALMLESSTPAHASEDSAVKNASFTFNNDISSAEALVNGEEASCTVAGKTVTVDEELKQFCDYSVVVTVTDVNGQSLTETIYFSTMGSTVDILATDVSTGGASYAFNESGPVAKGTTNSVTIKSNSRSFVLYKVPVPETNGAPLDFYTFKFIGNVQNITLLKFPGEDWDTSTLTSNSESVKNITDNYSNYIASQDKKVVTKTKYVEEYTCDVTDYAKECIENNQEYMYFGVCAFNTTAAAYSFGTNHSYSPNWTYGVVNYKFEAVDVKTELEENVLSSLSFNLLTNVEDVNSVFAVRETESGDVVSASFEPGSESGTYTLSAPVELTEGVDYEFVLLGDSEDLYGNTVENDKILARFYAKGEAYTPEAKSDAEDVLDFKVNADTSTLTIFYKNPMYSNSNVEVSIVNKDSGDVAYNETGVSSTRGMVYLKDISLPDSGSYDLMVYPHNASYYLAKNFSFVSAEDTLHLWNTIASAGAAADISAEWDDISELFGFEDGYFEDITDMDGFFDKVEANRDSSISEMNAENIALMRTFVKNMSFFTAVEQAKDASKLIELLNSELVLIKSQDKEIHDMWVECSESEYAEKTADALIDIIESVSSVEELTPLMDKAFDVYRVEIILDLLEGADHSSEITDIILAEGNAKLLGIEEYIEEYEAIESKTAINESLMIKFDTAEDFEEFFAEALKEIPEPEDEKPSSPSSNKGSSGKGSSGKGGSTQFVSSAPVVQTPFNPFTDVENISWAKDHITKLYNKGVINGKSQNEFAPNDTITREEITKLLVTLGKFQPAEGTTGFDDVASGSWYEEYVNIAVSNGIVNGMGNSRFGTGMNATRQDIAVMIVNMLTKLGATVEEGNLSFGDTDAISDYAKNPVAFLASKGILNGDTFGNFNPKANATRAEVAVMLSRVCDVFAKEVK